MIRYFSLVLILAGTLCSISPAVAAASESSEQLPPLTLTIPENVDYRNYLGLNGLPGETFHLNDIDADLLLIQFFSMYCPFCQEEAPLINELFQAILDFSSEEFSVKMIGIGTNNSEFEVNHYRNTFNIQFPVFPDLDMRNYNSLGAKGTPSFIACRKTADSECRIILRQSGGFNTVDEFFNKLLNRSGYR